jgi:hypothetical protein
LKTPSAKPAGSEARSFLQALFANKPDTAYILIWTLRGEVKRSRWFLDVNLAAAYVESLSGCNIYVGISLSPSDFGEFKRCDSENVAGLIGLGADIDLRSDAHPKGARPATRDQMDVSTILLATGFLGFLKTAIETFAPLLKKI